MFTFPNIYSELIALLTITMVVAAMAIRLRQPLIIAFIAVGILVGPVGLNCIRATEQIHLFAEMGLALLLFVVGLKLDPQLIRSMGKVALATGLGQMVFTALLGFALIMLLGMPVMTAIYIAVAIVFSSTILIVKLLSDKRETDALHGQIALGFLIVEDIVVVLAMIGLSAFTGASAFHPGLQVVLIVLKGAGLFFGVWAASRFLFPRILPTLAHSTEVLVLFGITWALLLAAVAELLGFNKEVGAFIAGLSLASTLYRDQLSAKLVSLRDFLLLFFFIELGSHLDLRAIGSQLLIAIPLSLLVLVGKPFAVMAILGKMGYRKRTGFMAGLTVAQISEFSLILVAMGVAAGHIGSNAMGVVTLVLLITMGLSTHLIMHAQGLYERLAPYLKVFEGKPANREDTNRDVPAMDQNSVILVGLGSYGSNIGVHLCQHGRMVLGVDFNPQAVAAWMARGQQAVFGDAEDPDLAHALPLSRARWVVSSIRDPRINAGIIRTLRHAGYRGHIACAVQDRQDATTQEQADLVFVPSEDAAIQAVDLLIDQEATLERNAMDSQIAAMAGHHLVCGYGRMGQQIVKDFTRQQVPYVVVEDNPEQLPKLREQQIPHVIGNASEDDVLLRAGVARAKGLIAVASSDEVNVFIVLTARVLNPNLYIVARSIREENEDKLRRAGADKVMSPYILGGHRMATAVTRPGILEFLDLLVHSDKLPIEIGIITVEEGSAFDQRTVEAIGLGQTYGITLLAVRRLGEELQANPRADYRIRAGDELIIIGTLEQLEAIEAHTTPLITNDETTSRRSLR
ncbi:MAG: cation:proton antiporter domain-containing protein [Armatimonadota bacterium]